MQFFSLICFYGKHAVSCPYQAVVAPVRRSWAAVFGRNLDLVCHDAPAVQHFGTGAFQLLQDLGQLSVIIARWAPAQHSRQIIARTQRQHSQLALLVEVEFINLRQDPAHTAVPSAHQNPEVVKLLKKPQTEVWPTVHEVKYLGWV